MAMDYDLVIIGGGLAGASLAKVMAEHGCGVLVLERETVFQDRVRGEALISWGVVEARALGIYEPLKQACGHEIAWFGAPADGRDLLATTPHHTGFLNFYHPAMQTALLKAAVVAGAHVRRGVAVTCATPGRPATVTVAASRGEETLRARLVVGADGRNSVVRTWGGFTTCRTPGRIVTTGLLHAGLHVPEDAAQALKQSATREGMLVFPIGGQRFRTYFMSPKDGARRRFSRPQHVSEFVRACVETGASPDWFQGAEVAGPLASFSGGDTWADHPYQNGLVLVGDAAGTTDPAYGNGLSKTLRDVRVLRDQLICQADWDVAGHAYADEHSRYHGALQRVLGWVTELNHAVGPEADARRGRVDARLAEEPDRLPDLIGLGPDVPSDETARRRFFCEDSR